MFSDFAPLLNKNKFSFDFYRMGDWMLYFLKFLLECQTFYRKQKFYEFCLKIVDSTISN